MQEYLEIKQAVNKIVQAKVLTMEMESSGESTDEEGSGQSCIWIRAVARTLIGGGGCIFMYSCSAQQISFQIKFKFINLKRNLSGET